MLDVSSGLAHARTMSCRCLIAHSFAQAKKCTNEGRALMQLDYKQFLSKVEKLTPVK